MRSPIRPSCSGMIKITRIPCHPPSQACCIVAYAAVPFINPERRSILVPQLSVSPLALKYSMHDSEKVRPTALTERIIYLYWNTDGVPTGMDWFNPYGNHSKRKDRIAVFVYAYVAAFELRGAFTLLWFAWVSQSRLARAARGDSQIKPKLGRVGRTERDNHHA